MQQHPQKTTPTLDPEEIARFGAMADEWWDPKGKFRPLHKISPARLAFFREQICRHFGRDEKAANALNGLSLIDIGCGGGLVAEPMAKQGATVTAIDPAEQNIKAASLHAEQQGVSIDYRACRAEDVAEKGETFDVVLLLEVVEHVPSVPDFTKIAASLVAPGGLLIMSTINRTTKAFALAIVGAEYILRWLPRGTHQWNRFVTPDELANCAEAAGLLPRERHGLTFNPLRDEWRISSDTDVNYFLTASRPS
ncbi:MAG: ubiquinone biosynthesis O-methyltransferase [Rhodomicrobium sp.]|nr:MAG: ubiquinone biosynthesis O-methyltransferase [Rhodomicrobium sp.]